MDRRTFARTLPVAALGAVACAGDRGGPLEVVEPREPYRPPPDHAAPGDRAAAIAAGLVHLAQAGPGGARWPATVNGSVAYPIGFYTGQSGIVAFLAEAYRYRPDNALRDTVLSAAQALQSASAAGGRGLYDGNSGRAWAWLAVHRAFGGAQWVQAASSVGQAIAAGTTGLPGDLLNGPPGQALVLLRLHEVTGEARWLNEARRIADVMLTRAMPADGGIKIPSFTDAATGAAVCYTGLSHGSAGAGWFLCRLARLLPAAERARYSDAAEAIAAWLHAISRDAAGNIGWYRREPDQLHQTQFTWCHGPPGIGLFFLELYRLTGDAAYLHTAQRCGDATIANTRPQHGAGICHGSSGNAALLLELHTATGAAKWREHAREFGDFAWARRGYAGQAPVWSVGGHADHSAMLGGAGVGWFMLQLATDSAVTGPATPYL
jgi:lantibiotic modifying enzyme